jgi:glycosyltransferase involved in cell wall biosynthesis
LKKEKRYSGRIKQWWKPKAGVLLALLVLTANLANPRCVDFTWIAVLSIITLVGIAFFGHLINDLGDMDTDQIAGKNNSMLHRSLLYRGGLVAISLALAIIPWFYLPITIFSLLLLTIEAILFISYSLPPIRIKNRPVLAIFWDSAYAFVLPASLAVYTYSLAFDIQFSTLFYVSLSIWLTALGLRQIINHHIADKENDLRSNTPNLTNFTSERKLFKITKNLLIPIEFIAGLAALAQLWKMDKYVSAISISLFVLSFRLDKPLVLKPLFSNYVFGHFSSDKFYSKYWILALSFLLSFHDPQFVPVLIAIALLFTSFWKKPMSNSMQALKHHIRSTLSYLLNQSIYLFRKYVLRWSESKNRGSYYADWLKSQKGVIALCNQNLNKYTETFVNGHHNQLPFKVEYYYGKEQILFHGVDGNLIGKNVWLRELRSFIHAEDQAFSKLILAEDLNKRGVQLVLSEFGTTGVYMQEVAEKIGIPHVCIFYGYDIWHDGVRRQTDYSKLFNSAKMLIGVSRDICAELERMGCPKSKIQYLPCYVNLSLFKPPKKNVDLPIFLSVGRFTETKSPHLTILAFNEVLKDVPDAKLRMIGKDGGGELFEACQILVKALGIEDAVTFLGVLPPEGVAQEMQNARVFVQHSVTTPLNGDKEGTPVAIMEAMAVGLPVIATKHAGIAEMIEHNVTGVLVEEYNHHNMAHEMIRVCKDDALVQKLGKNASEFIKTNKLIVNHIEILADLILKNKVE